MRGPARIIYRDNLGIDNCPSYEIKQDDFFAYLAPGAKAPSGTLIPLTPDQKRLVDFAHGSASAEQKLVTIFNSVNHSGSGFGASFNYFWFNKKPNGNDPSGAGACYAWTAAQRSKLPASGSDLVVKEVEWRIYSFTGIIGAWSNHSAVRLEFPGERFAADGKLAVAYVDNGWIGGDDHIFFQWNIPGNYWNETPGRLSDGTNADHAGDPP